MKAHVVVNLGFGDAGKGLLTDWLVRTTGARLVVRYNGGAQAGHNVVTPDGRHHTFAQFGAGTFVPGTMTFLSRHFALHPTALLVEAEVLRQKGISSPLDRVAVSEAAPVTTPFHQAANRLREAARGAKRHGSVGVGVGETFGDALAVPDDTIVAGDLRAPARVLPKLARIRERKRAELRALEHHPEWRYLDDDGVGEAWLEQAMTIAPRVVPDAALAQLAQGEGGVVFEGAQGVLLDERRGFHPYTTWSDCTDANAVALAREYLPAADLRTIGVVRTHMVRHGPGPLPTETQELAIAEHNGAHPWQGPVRYGWFDGVLVRYALASLRAPVVLAVTHVDARGPWKGCAAWDVDGRAIDALAPLAPDGDGAHLTPIAERARPTLQSGDPLASIAALLGVRPAIVARGPTADDVTGEPP